MPCSGEMWKGNSKSLNYILIFLKKNLLDADILCSLEIFVKHRSQKEFRGSFCKHRYITLLLLQKSRTTELYLIYCSGLLDIQQCITVIFFLPFCIFVQQTNHFGITFNPFFFFCLQELYRFCVLRDLPSVYYGLHSFRTYG